MFVIAYLQQWNIDWLNFIFAVVYYAGGVIFLSRFGLSSRMENFFLPFLYGLHLILYRHQADSEYNRVSMWDTTCVCNDVKEV